MKIARREFLRSSAAGVGGVLFAAHFSSAAESRTRRFDPYEKVSLGRTKLKVSRVCLGTGMRGGNRQSNHTRMGQEKFTALIRGAYERGVKVFDLADMYGTHPFVVSALQGIPRDKYVIITKIWWRPGCSNSPERAKAWWA